MSRGNIESGHPVILKTGKGLGKYGLRKGMKGFANAVTTIPETNEAYVHFMPDNMREVFVISLDRVELDKERLEQLEGMNEVSD